MPPKRKASEITSLANRWTAAKKRARARARAAGPAYGRLVNLGAGTTPRSILVTLRYCAGFTGTNPIFDQVFNLNSTYDPDQTGTGHQPMGRDTYVTLFKRYRVWSVRVKVVASNDYSVSQDVGVIGLLADNQQTAYTNMDECMEQQGAYHTLTTGGGSPITIVRKYHLWKIAGVTKAGYKDDRFQSMWNTSPAETICLHVMKSTVLSAAPVSNLIRYRVQLDFLTEWFDPFSQVQS